MKNDFYRSIFYKLAGVNRTIHGIMREFHACRPAVYTHAAVE